MDVKYGIVNLMWCLIVSYGKFREIIANGTRCREQDSYCAGYFHFFVQIRKN
jgi:hypothetical protein